MICGSRGRNRMNVRPIAAVLLLVLLSSFFNTPVGADPPDWRSPLALGPSDAMSVAARDGLMLVAGRPHFRETFGGAPQVIPSPRVAGLFRSTDQGRTWSLGERATGGGQFPFD